MKSFRVVLLLMCVLLMPVVADAQVNVAIKKGGKNILEKVVKKNAKKHIGSNAPKYSLESRIGRKLAVEKTVKAIDAKGFTSIMAYSRHNARTLMQPAVKSKCGRSVMKNASVKEYNAKLKETWKHVGRTYTRLKIKSKDQFITSKRFLELQAKGKVSLILGKEKDGGILRENMLRCMPEKVRRILLKNGSQAHHIVGNRTPIAAAKLKKYGIDINDPRNGIFLPDSGESGLKGVVHKGNHSNDYYDYIEQRFANCKSKEECLEVLDDVKNELYTGKIKLYREGKNTINKTFNNEVA